MPIVHTNRRGKIYYLHKGHTKAGSPKYFFSMKKVGDLVDKMPDGFEVYENPVSSQVLLRRVQPQMITEDEKKLIERYVKKALGPKQFVIDTSGNVITVFESMDDPLIRNEIFKAFPDRSRMDVERLLSGSTSYAPMLRFTLKDEEKRKFLIERYGFNGTTETWIPADRPDILERLVKIYS